MKSLVTRFHTLLLTVTVAITIVAWMRVPAGFAYPAHWAGSAADWVWLKEQALVVAPVLQALLMAGFFVMGRLFTPNQFAKSQHILDPALTLMMGVVMSCQMGLLLSGIGSDLDLIRVTGFALGLLLLGLAVILFEAERHTYAGLRMPWPIRSDRAWTLVHRSTALGFGAAGAGLLAAAWMDVGAGMLTAAYAAALIVPAALGGAVSLLARRL
jgi:uncharacterized membrane protein